MNIYEKKTTIKNVLKEVYCDKCGKKIKYNNFDAYDYSWFHYRTGKCYPEGTFGKTVSMELCEKCAENLAYKLIEMGYDIRIEDIEE